MLVTDSSFRVNHLSADKPKTGKILSNIILTTTMTPITPAASHILHARRRRRRKGRRRRRRWRRVGKLDWLKANTNSKGKSKTKKEKKKATLQKNWAVNTTIINHSTSIAVRCRNLGTEFNLQKCHFQKEGSYNCLSLQHVWQHRLSGVA